MIVVDFVMKRAAFMAIIMMSLCAGIISCNACGGMINISDSGYGSIQSPGFPNGYPSNINCTWFITTDVGRVVRFIVDAVDLRRSHSTCSEHYVIFYDGPIEDNVIVNSYEGCTEVDFLPHAFTTSQNEACVLFSSGDTLSIYDGFHADYEDTILCGGMFNASIPGWFTSDNYPDDYDDFQNCTWYIFAEDNALVELTILDFSLESDSSCDYDVVTIYDGDIMDPILFHECFSSISSPISVLSSQSYVTVVFETDWSIGDSGFNITYMQFIELETTQSLTTENIESTTIYTTTTPATYVTTTAATLPTSSISSTTNTMSTASTTVNTASISTASTDVSTPYTLSASNTMSTASTPVNTPQLVGIHGASTTAEANLELVYSTNTISQSENTPATTSVTNGNSELIVCQPLPTWLNLEFDSFNHSLGDSVTYTCQDGYQFTDDSNDNEKYSECEQNTGQWVEAFTACEAIGLAAALAQIQEPVEAEHAKEIGFSFVILGLGIEIGVLVLLDFHSIMVNLKLCKRRVKRRSRKVEHFGTD